MNELEYEFDHQGDEAHVSMQHEKAHTTNVTDWLYGPISKHANGFD